MPGHTHSDLLRRSGPHHIPDSRSSEIVEQASADTGFFAGFVPGASDVFDASITISVGENVRGDDLPTLSNLPLTFEDFNQFVIEIKGPGFAFFVVPASNQTMRFSRSTCFQVSPVISVKRHPLEWAKVMKPFRYSGHLSRNARNSLYSKKPVRTLFSFSIGMCGTLSTRGGVCWAPRFSIRFKAESSRLTVAFDAPDSNRSTIYGLYRGGRYLGDHIMFKRTDSDGQRSGQPF